MAVLVRIVAVQTTVSVTVADAAFAKPANTFCCTTHNGMSFYTQMET